jgi:hypothetical protein
MENIVDTFTNGFKNLYKNKILLLPFLVFTILYAVYAIVLTIIPLIETEINQLVLDVGVGIVSLIFVILSLYVSAGMIGMSKEAVSTGKTKFKDLFTYGNKYTIRFIFATLILSILQLVTIVFWLPVIFLFMNSGYTIDLFLDLLANNFDALIPLFKTLLIPALFCSLLTLIYSIAIWVLFYFVTYAIVVDDLSVIASFKKSYSTVRQHIWKVILFIISIYAITIGVIIVAYSIFCFIMLFMMLFLVILIDISQTLAIIGLIILLILMVLLLLFLLFVIVFISVAAIIWETRFYMAMTEKEMYIEEK